jgi:AcrR family transcriptional regulator
VTRSSLRREHRVSAILESAIAAFRRHGYHGTSMEQIADQLLMTKGSLYYYFSDKEEILFAAHDLALDRILVELARVRRKSGCPCGKLDDILAAHIRIMVEGFSGTALALEFGALSTRRLGRVIAKRDRFERGLRDLIRKGSRQGCFRPVDPKMAVMALLGSINWIARWYRPGGPAGAEEVTRQFVDLFMGGLLPRGRAQIGAHRTASGASASRLRIAGGSRAARREP